jgi:hypothetical protein
VLTVSPASGSYRIRYFLRQPCIADSDVSKFGLAQLAGHTPIHGEQRTDHLFQRIFDPGSAEIRGAAFSANMIEQHNLWQGFQQLFGHCCVHTFGMTLKNAAFFALIGMLLWTVVLTARLIINISAAVNGAVPAITVLTLLIEWLASLSLLVFFAVFHKSQ